MLTRLARLTVAHRRLVVALSVAAIVAAGAFGGDVARHLVGGGFEDPGSESVRTRKLLERRFGAGNPNLVLLAEVDSGTVDDPRARTAGVSLTRALAGEEHVTEVVSYWETGAPALRSDDGTQALVMARITGSDDEILERVEDVSPRHTGRRGLLEVRAGGQAEVFRQVSEQVERDLARAESVTLPIVLILLVLVFGSVVAAGLPLAVGIVAIIGTFAVLRLLTLVTDVSIFALNLTTMLGLGLGIDYALFMVSRYREELGRGREPHAAVVRTVETAGRTVLFSAATVAISLAALMVFPMPFLKSFAYAGIAVVALAAGAAVVFLPALMAVIGRRIDKWVLWRRRRVPEGRGFWHGLATFVMRRPVIVAVGVTVFLLVLGAPFLSVEFGQPDDRVLPESASARRVQDDIRTNFSSQEATALAVVAHGAEPRSSDVDAYAADLSRIDGVARVDASTGSYAAGERVRPPGPGHERFSSPAGAWVMVVPEVEPISSAGERLVADVRGAPAPFDVGVAGLSADLVDSKSALFGRVPLAAALIAAVTLVVLFLMSGSVLVPVKAVVLNLLSLSATFGAMVWIFQEGNLSGILDFTATGTIDITSPILMFCVAFGLSMDYEVFLLSRIKEEYDLTGDNVWSVATGLERTGRIVTAAAGLIAVVFAAFATSEITFIKLFGVGLTLAVVMDASLIRGTLVPAFMRLAGTANWWAPRPLRSIYERFGLKEAGDEPAVQPVRT